MRESGASFSAGVESLTPTSLFLVTQEALGYRERVYLDLLGVRGFAEVVSVSQSPPGFGLMLEPNPEVQSAIQAELERAAQPGTNVHADWIAYWHSLAPDQQAAYWAQLDDAQRLELSTALSASSRPAPAFADPAASDLAAWWSQAPFDHRLAWFAQLSAEQQAGWWAQLPPSEQAQLATYLGPPDAGGLAPAWPLPTPEQQAWWASLPPDHQAGWWMQLTQEQRASWWPLLTPEQQAWWWNQMPPELQAWWQANVISAPSSLPTASPQPMASPQPTASPQSTAAPQPQRAPDSNRPARVEDESEGLIDGDIPPGVFPVIVEGEVDLDGDLEALAACLWVLAGRPLITKGSASGVVLIRHGDAACSFDPTVPLPGGLVALEPRDEEAVRQLARSVAKALDAAIAPRGRPRPVNKAPAPQPPQPEAPRADATTRAPAPEPDEAEPAASEVPELVGDSVRFRSRAQLRVQFRANLKQSALVVKSAPIAQGTAKTLELQVPGTSERVVLYATAAFAGPGTVGFVLSDFDKKKAAIEALMSGSPLPAAPPPAPAQSSAELAAIRAGAPEVPTEWSGPYVGATPARDLMDFTSKAPETIAGCKKSYVAILDLILRSPTTRAVVRFKLDKEKSLFVTIADSRIHHARWEPMIEEDTLGRRLMRDKKISNTTLRDALARSAQTKQPLGSTLVSMGKLTKATLHATIREQIFDRVSSVIDSSGMLEIRPYSEPESSGGIAVSYPGPALVAGLLRELIRRVLAPDLEALLTPYNDRELIVVASRLDPNLLIPKKEMRFYERAQAGGLRLGDAPVATATTPSDTHRAVLLGLSLGILELGGRRTETAGRDKNVEVIKDYRLRLSQAEAGSPFEALGLHWSASEASIEAAFSSLTNEIKATERSALGDAKQLASRYLQVVTKAHESIASKALRREVRDRSVGKAERRTAADHLVNQAEMMLIRGSTKEARVALETAEELASTQKAVFLLDRIRKGLAGAEAKIEED
ncbi:MAG: hypothetical protein HYV07_04420 [Deltaproteobacteria bacterium]|nr:hypothetical protein [Deltaproteobacteria bacterium]